MASSVTVGSLLAATVTVVVWTLVLFAGLGSKVALPTVTVLVMAPVSEPVSALGAAHVVRLP